MMNEQTVSADEDSPCKRRRLNPVVETSPHQDTLKSSPSSLSVGKDPNSLHLLHSSGVGPEGGDLSTRVSTETHMFGLSKSDGALLDVLEDCGFFNEEAEDGVSLDELILNKTPSTEDDETLEDGEIPEDIQQQQGKPKDSEKEDPEVTKNKKHKPPPPETNKEKSTKDKDDNSDMEISDDDEDEEEEDFVAEKKDEMADELKIEDNFFTREPFTSEELRLVEESVKSQMEKSVSLLEKEGYRVFEKWNSKKVDPAPAVVVARKRMQQAMEDAKISGAPREYQQRLFEIACIQNTIIHLGTGAGKTLIALMLIRHFAAAFEKGKQTLFLVPSVALAIQQSTVLRSNLPYSVQVACYATSSTAKARKALQEANIIVATHGAIHDLLSHYGDIFKMENFFLLIIDEVHYCIGAHTYATIMKRFYHTLPPKAQPRVLGLTASPLVKVKASHSNDNLDTMLQSLETNLNATIVSHLSGSGVSPSESKQTGADPSRQLAEEKEIVYSPFVPPQPLPSFAQLQVHATRGREVAQLTNLYENLGPLALSIYCQTLAREVSRNSFERESTSQFGHLVDYLHELSRVCDKLCRDCPHGGRSDKLLALEELMEDVVEDHGSKDTVVLIFVERRITAMALNDFFKWRHKATTQNNWRRASEVRTRLPKLRSNESSPCPSPTHVQNLSVFTSPPSSSPEITPSNSLDQFADADSDFELEVTVSKREETDRRPLAEKEEDSNRNPSTGMLVSQFDDASDEESQGDMEQYLAGIRSLLREGGAPGQAGKPRAKGKAKDDCNTCDQVHGDRNDADRTSDRLLGRDGVAVNAQMDCDIHQKRVRRPSSDQFEGEQYMVFTAAETQVRTDKETIRCQALVRKSTNIFKSLNKSRQLSKTEDEKLQEDWLHHESKIRDVLAGLRRGDINVLVATSVVEEGVDVQACNCVVAFDSLRSAKGYVQMRGRARAKDAKFFVFKNTREQTTTLSLDSAQEIEERVHRFISSRTSKASINFPLKESVKEFRSVSTHGCAEIRAVETGRYDAAHGTVELNHAKSLLNRYVLSLPIDPAARASKQALQAFLPVYSPKELHLPSHLPSRVRWIQLPPRYWNLGRKETDKILALMACVRLHLHGLLNDRLLPLTRNDLQEIMMKKATQEPRELPIKSLGPFCVFGKTTRTVFVYPFYQKNSRIDKLHKTLRSKGHSLAIITINPLPNIPEMRVSHPGFGMVACSLGEGFHFDCTPENFSIILRFFKVIFDSRWRRRTKNVFFRPKKFEELSSLIQPYFVGCLSARGQLDFVQMSKLVIEYRRSEAERIDAVQATPDVAGLPEPRMWAPLYDQNFTYIAFGPSGKSCGSEFPNDGERDDGETIINYKDYFLLCRDHIVDDKCLLVDAQRLWSLPFSKVSTEEEQNDQFEPKETPSVHSTKHVVCQDLKSLLLPKDACIEVPMADPNFLLLATHLPQFLNHMQSYLTAHEFTRHCQKYLPHLAKCLKALSAEQVAEALTAKSCAEEDSYEKLEWLGDGVLKMIQTDSLIYSRDFHQWIEFLHEGDLSTLRSVMGRNDRLAVACKQLKIDQFLLTSPLGRVQWTPASLDLYSPVKKGLDNGEGMALEETIPGKACADVIESILGLVYLNCGYENATKVADELQISLPQVDDRKQALPKRNIAPKPLLLSAATAFTGHPRFERPDFVQEAFTHPTAMHPQTPSYQRLEWIGDAVLCLAAREWIYKTFPAFEVGKMVEMEASLVSNETLAFLSIKQGVLKYLDHCDQTLPGQIEYQLWCTQELGRGLWATDPPKLCADVVESLIGAVYLDSGLAPGLSAVSKILKPLYRCLLLHERDGTIDTMHPRKVMQEMGGKLLTLDITREEDFASRNPKARVWLGRRWGFPRLDSQDYVASVMCLGVAIVCLSDRSSEVAGNRACAFTVSMLRRNPSLLRRVQSGRTLVESSSSKTNHLADGKQSSIPGADGISAPEDDADKLVQSIVEVVLNDADDPCLL